MTTKKINLGMHTLCLLGMMGLLIEAHAQIAEIQVTDRRVLQVLDIYLDSIKVLDSQPGVLLLEFSSVSRNYTLEEADSSIDFSLMVRAVTSKHQITSASFYSTYRKRGLLIYTGVERLSKLPNNQLKLPRKISRSLGPDGMMGSFPPVWFKATGNSIAIQRPTR
jgi:hypothetical protein